MELKANACAGSQHSCLTEDKELYANKPSRTGSPLYQEYHKERYSRQHCFCCTKIYRTISIEEDAAKLQHDRRLVTRGGSGGSSEPPFVRTPLENPNPPPPQLHTFKP